MNRFFYKLRFRAVLQQKLPCPQREINHVAQFFITKRRLCA
jgi:hypothetical protein